MRWLLIFSCLISSLVFAGDNKHYFMDTAPEMTTIQQAHDLKYPGYCEIEIVNNSSYDVFVYGIFDDGSPLHTFRIYAHEYPHYISLYYYGYCHYGMDIYIETVSGYRIYSRYTRRYKTIYITNYYYSKPPQAIVKNKTAPKTAKV